jgi:hypothetical protein
VSFASGDAGLSNLGLLLKIGIGVAIGIGLKKLDPDSDTDTDPEGYRKDMVRALHPLILTRGLRPGLCCSALSALGISLSATADIFVTDH